MYVEPIMYERNRSPVKLVCTKVVKGVVVHLNYGVTREMTKKRIKEYTTRKDVYLLPAEDVGLEWRWTDNNEKLDASDQWQKEHFVFVSKVKG